MERRIRLGTMADADALGRLYDDLNDALAGCAGGGPGWKRGVYPTRSDAVQGIREGALYVAEEDGRIAGSLILRHRPEAAYSTVRWGRSLSDDQIFVIYTFAVHPRFHRRGVGRSMLAFAGDLAAARGLQALRLDVSEHNLPAIRLYEACGFQYVDTVDLGLEAYGLKWFRLYEKLL